MKFGLPEHIIEKLQTVFQKFPEIEEVVIYGSRAKGNYREGSDIDITLKGKNLTDGICSKVWLDIDALNTPYLVDLSVWHLLTSEGLKSHIQRQGKLLYRKERKIATN